ncbi:MAG: hypothetical protein IJF73_03255, partial [Clostridia bacterium]|nr:hypothetical protein [Clostridia bacterium]
MKQEKNGLSEERCRVVGSVESVIYRSEKTDYTVIELLAEDGTLVVAVGTMPYLSEGEEAELVGTWTRHAEYGRQLLVESYEKKLPTDAAAILKYLSSRTVRGVGAATAIKIVERYGEDSFDVIENHPEWLSDIPGISKKRAREIHDSFCEQSGIRNLMMFCRDTFGSNVITRIYKQWGSRSVDYLRENPYRLCHEVYGIGFDRADALARSLGVSADSEERLLAGLTYLLQYNASTNGHICVPKDKLIPAVAQELGVEAATVEGALRAAERARLITVDTVADVPYVYLTAYHRAECFLAKKLKSIDRQCPTLDHRDIDRLVERCEIES